MKNLKRSNIFYLVFLSVILNILFISCMTTKLREKKFANACQEENKKGLSLSHINGLHKGYRDHEDYGSLDALKKNCPKSTKRYLH